MQQPAEKPLLLKKHVMAEEALAEREGEWGGGEAPLLSHQLTHEGL